MMRLASWLAISFALLIGCPAPMAQGVAERVGLGASQYVPQFLWNAIPGVLPSGSTFTRASSGRYFNSAGVLTQASTNVARFDYNPVTLQPLGYLAEMQSTNGLLQSGDLSNAAWTASGVTVTGNSVVAPDGTTTMAKLVESAANVAHKVSQAVTLTTATTAGFSFFVEAKERSKFYISIQVSAGNYATAIFDTAGAGTTASQTSVGGTSGAVGETIIRNVGGGIYRISMQAQVAGANPTVVLGLASLATGNTVNTTGDVTYAGDGTSAGYGWGAQFDTAGVGVTSYIPTAGSTVTRSGDVLTMPASAIAGWNPNADGGFVVEYMPYTVTVAEQSLLYAYKTNSSNSVLVGLFGGNNGGAGWQFSGGSAMGHLGGSTPVALTAYKQANFWSGSQKLRYAVNGGAVQTSPDAQVPLPVGMDSIGFYYVSGGGNQPNSAIKSVRYYAGARSDAFVRQVSR